MDASVYVILCCLVIVLGGDASGSCGALTVMKPTFVNRNVTLNFIPQNKWITNIVWKYSPWWDKTSKYAVEMLKGRFQQTVQDGSHYHSFLFYGNKNFNNSKIHVQCSRIMEVSRSNTVNILLREIRHECGNLVLLSPEIKYGTDVEIAYYPSDNTLIAGNIWFHERTFLKGVAQLVHHRNDTFEERKMSVYLYIFTIHNFTESKAGHYALRCGKKNVFITNWLNIHVTGDTVFLEGSFGNDTRANGLCNETKWMSNIIEVEEDGKIKQKSRPPKNGFTFHPEPTSVAGGNSTRSFKVTLEPIFIGTGAFVALCVFVASARSLVRWHKGRNRTRDPDNTEAVTIPAIEVSPSLDTNEYVEMPDTSMHVNASHDLEDDYVELKIQENSMMARKPITAIESKHGESSLIYADLDIDHLQQACVGPIPGPRPTIGKEETVYDDIDFSYTNPAEPHLVF